MVGFLKKLHLFGLFRSFCFFLVNYVFIGTRPCFFYIKTYILRLAGYNIGKNTKIVGAIRVYGNITIGDNCWINRDLVVHGNGNVIIGDNCDIAPGVTFLTGGHSIGLGDRRAGQGEKYLIVVKNGCWIGAHSTILGNVTINSKTIVAACSCVIKDCPCNVMVAGVPAKIKKKL